jgi:DNA-binding CsgD family transcriptional regulator
MESQRGRNQFTCLSPREAEILALIGQGLTSKEIANRLTLSCHTVANHRKHICKKLGLSSTAELAAAGARFSLLARDVNM